ncbi:MAG TPA: phosphoribosylanthranilate isomerase [Rudaea sp.]|jgi:phosphoribosylanthranilate isomerase
MQRTRVKFCGVTRIDDALAAAALGVDAIGFVLTRKSRRFAGIERARQMRRALPPFVMAVALFMDDDVSFVSEAVAAVAPDLLQFHGSEAALDCVRYGRPYLKAVAMRDGLDDWQMLVDSHAQAAGFLFDGHAAGEQGGAGRRFDWSALPRDPGKPVVLAGGLTPENVGVAIRAVRPWAVDVSSGIESEAGLKDMDKMRRFIAAVRMADEVG